MSVTVGELAQYLSRTILIVDQDDYWVWGIELGETQVGKYKKRVVKKLNEEEREPSIKEMEYEKI